MKAKKLLVLQEHKKCIALRVARYEIQKTRKKQLVVLKDGFHSLEELLNDSGSQLLRIKKYDRFCSPVARGVLADCEKHGVESCIFELNSFNIDDSFDALKDCFNALNKAGIDVLITMQRAPNCVVKKSVSEWLKRFDLSGFKVAYAFIPNKKDLGLVNSCEAEGG